MSGVIVRTVPTLRPATYGKDAEVIVGMSELDGNTLWVPGGGKGPEYPDYDARESAERMLPLDDAHSDRLISFFEERLLPNVEMPKPIGGLWDCHWFALCMKGLVTDPKTSLNETEAIQDANLLAGKKIEPSDLNPGEIGIIGGRREQAGVGLADHSVIGLRENYSLQVLGKHGVLAIVNNKSATDAYQSSSRGNFFGREYGMFISDGGQDSVLSKLYRRLFGGDERT